MALTLLLQLALIIVLVILSGFFSASEIAIVAIRTSRLKELVSAGSKRAEMVKKLKSNPDDFFAVVQVGMTVTASAASAIGGAAAITVIGPLVKTIPIAAIQTAAEPISVTLVIMIISYLFLVVAELVPKAIAIRQSESIALWAGAPTWYSLRSMIFFIRILTASTNLCLKLLGFSAKQQPDTTVSETEVKLIVREGFEKGVFDQEEQQLIQSVFEFTDTTVKRAMTPRTDIVAFDVNNPTDKILRAATEERFSRFPVYEENIDNIKGIIHSRDLLFVYTQKELFVMKDIIKPAIFVPDSKPISELLREMQKSKYHMAIVLDEFGGTDGIITMEDVIEEIVGDIQDEYDHETSKIVFLDQNKARLKASMPVDEFANEFDVKIEEGDYETVAGMVIAKLGRIPAKNELIDFNKFSLEVYEKDGHKIKTLIAQKKTGGKPKQ
ncbi:MAG: HlyC/CorC family transporter [candidate division Zixibacteria bacterium]|nr:HlyC/CorC family transporter [candidate division Zixibacteria bacterium]